MIDQPQRVEAFKAEIAEMSLPDPASGRDRLLLRAGGALMALGVVLMPVAYVMSHDTLNALQQRDAQVVAIMGLVFAVVGGALFLRYSLAQFLRFWLARLSWEQQAQTDRLVDAVRADPAPVPAARPTATTPTKAAAPAKGAPAKPAGAKAPTPPRKASGGPKATPKPDRPQVDTTG